jgi:hypothetical protein
MGKTRQYPRDEQMNKFFRDLTCAEKCHDATTYKFVLTENLLRHYTAVCDTIRRSGYTTPFERLLKKRREIESSVLVYYDEVTLHRKLPRKYPDQQKAAVARLE